MTAPATNLTWTDIRQVIALARVMRQAIALRMEVSVSATLSGEVYASRIEPDQVKHFVGQHAYETLTFFAEDNASAFQIGSISFAWSEGRSALVRFTDVPSIRELVNAWKLQMQAQAEAKVAVQEVGARP